MKEYRMSQPKLFEKLIQVFGSISAISGKKILVIRDLEVALMLSVRNVVVYITDDEECSEAFRRNTEAGMGNDDVVLFINKWNNKLKFNKVFEKMGKFDVAIMNPPYDRNLHLKILEAVIPHAEKTINISPVRWLQDPFAPYLTRSDYCKFEESVSKKIESLDIISAKDASKLFDAAFVMNLGIYTCSENGGYQYQHKEPLITKIVEKTMQHSWSPYSMQNFYRNGGVVTKPYILETGCFGGSASIGFDILMCQSYKTQCEFTVKDYQIKHYISGKMKGACHFEFATEEERKNFYNCYTHPFMKWTYHLWKEDVNIRDYKVPYFDDYTHPWKLKDFFAWFELTKAEQSRVIQEIRQMRHDKRQ